jgi:hypothetical protein
MLSAIISTHESERSLVPTLAALVPGAAAGLLAEVVIADADSRDATAEVADIAGCRFLASGEPLGVRLKAAAATTRSPWLMFLQAGSVPQPGWIEAADHFIRTTGASDGTAKAAVFRTDTAVFQHPGFAEFVTLVVATFGGAPKPEQGLLIARRVYETVGGHRVGEDAEADLLRRIGRRRVTILPATLTSARLYT